MKPKNFYVYVDYTRDNPPRPFYVGKGISQRVRDTRRNVYHTRIGKKHGWYRVIVNATEDEQEAFAIEKQLIRMLGTRETAGGCNFTDGGEGMSGYVPSGETRGKMSAAKREMWQDPEFREKRVAVMRKLAADHTWREKTAAANCKKAADPVWRANTSAAIRIYWMMRKAAVHNYEDGAFYKFYGITPEEQQSKP